jgi:hypothetical protein
MFIQEVELAFTGGQKIVPDVGVLDAAPSDGLVWAIYCAKIWHIYCAKNIS